MEDTTNIATDPPGYDDLVGVEDDDGNQSDWWNPRATAYGPKPSALVSIVCSYVVIREVLKDHKKLPPSSSHHGCRTANSSSKSTASKAIGKILLSMSVSDIIYSLAWFLSTWPSPKGDEYWYLYQNVGTTATCTFQGFLYQFGFVASPLFNMNLAVFYLLIVKYNFTENRLKQLEKWVHGIIWLFVLIASLYPIPLQLYNNNWEFCWFDSYPPDCKDSWTYGDEADCTRGDNAWIHGLFFLIFPSWFCLLVVSVTFFVLLRTIQQAENRNSLYGSSGVFVVENKREQSTSNIRQRQRRRTSINRNKSKLVAKRALMYAVAFLFTYSLAFVTSVRWYTTGKYNTAFDFCSYFLLPLQGFFNFFVFAWYRQSMKTKEGQILRRIIFSLGNICSSRLGGHRSKSDGTSEDDDVGFSGDLELRSSKHFNSSSSASRLFSPTASSQFVCNSTTTCSAQTTTAAEGDISSSIGNNTHQNYKQPASELVADSDDASHDSSELDTFEENVREIDATSVEGVEVINELPINSQDLVSLDDDEEESGY